ncbi:unnamed protein product [Chrysoparadoxa australica]
MFPEEEGEARFPPFPPVPPDEGEEGAGKSEKPEECAGMSEKPVEAVGVRRRIKLKPQSSEKINRTGEEESPKELNEEGEVGLTGPWAKLQRVIDEIGSLSADPPSTTEAAQAARSTIEIAKNKLQSATEGVAKTLDPEGYISEHVCSTMEIAKASFETAHASVAKVVAEGQKPFEDYIAEQMAQREKFYEVVRNENLTDTVISRRSSHSIPFNITKGSTLFWEFRVKECDLGFAVKRRVQGMGGSIETEVVPLHRFEAGSTYQGQWEAEEDCNVFLFWDNSYSFLRSKMLAMKAQVVTLSDKKKEESSPQLVDFEVEHGDEERELEQVDQLQLALSTKALDLDNDAQTAEKEEDGALSHPNQLGQRDESAALLA